MDFIRRLWARRTLKFIMVVMACSSSLLMVVTVGGLRWVRRAADARLVEVLHSREITTQVYALARSASLAQTNRDVYLFTRDPRARAAYERAIEVFQEDLASLSKLVAGDAPQSERVDRISRLFDAMERETASEYLDFTAMSLTDYQRRMLVRQIETMGAIQDTLKELVSAQKDTVAGSARASDELNRVIDFGAVIATCLLVTWSIVGIFVFSREVIDPLAAMKASAQAIARGELDGRLPVRRQDEIGALAVSFNEMAEQLEQQRRSNDVLRELRELMHSVRDLDEVERVLALLVPDCLPQTSGRLYLLDTSGELLLPRGGWAIEGDAKPCAASSCWAFRLGRAHEVSRTKPNVPCTHVQRQDRNSLCLPLSAGGAINGILEVTFEDSNPRGISEVGESLALALANIRLREKMREEAQRDALTKLFNRRYFDRVLRHEIAQAGQAGTSFSVALLDVDHFKRFNDIHGHAVGDAVLGELAATLKRTCRGSDVACRYGGEEFVVLLPSCNIEDGLRKAEAIRSAVGTMSVQTGDRPLENITVSIGVAEFPMCGQDAATLLSAADKALYRSKTEGRDRVSSALGCV